MNISLNWNPTGLQVVKLFSKKKKKKKSIWGEKKIKNKNGLLNIHLPSQPPLILNPLPLTFWLP